MQTLDHDEVSNVIAAPPERLYALVTDVTRTPEFSPDIVRCSWLDGARGPAVGARFEAVNRTEAGKTWNRPVSRSPTLVGNSPSPARSRSPGRSPGATAPSRSTRARASSRATRSSGR